MIIVEYRVVGDHPINLRPDKTFKYPSDAVAYGVNLVNMGYENVAVKIVPIGE